MSAVCFTVAAVKNVRSEHALKERLDYDRVQGEKNVTTKVAL